MLHSINTKRIITGLLAAVLALGISAQALITKGEGRVHNYLSAYDSDVVISALQEELYYAIAERQETIDFSDTPINYTEFRKVWKDLRYDHPDLYMISSSYTYTYRTIDGIKYVIKVSPHYTMTAEEMARAQEIWCNTILMIVGNLDEDWTDVQKALYLHDYLVSNYEYDLTYTNYDAYSLFTTGTGVCMAYTLAYKALMNAAGIPCDYVVSEEMNHAWNRVILDGKAYNVDATWDDPTFDRLNRVEHEDFLVSDAALGDTHSYTWAEGYGQCASTTYDKAVWTDANTAFIPMGDKFYFIKKGVIYSWDGTKTKKCRELTSKWYTNSKKNSYWRYTNSDGSYNTNYSVMQAAGDKILYNTAYSIKTFDPDTNKLAVIYEYKGKGCIYGFHYNGSSITLQVASSPNDAFELITVTKFKQP